MVERDVICVGGFIEKDTDPFGGIDEVHLNVLPSSGGQETV